MKNISLKTEIIPLLIIVLSFVCGFYFQQIMPDRVPLHWNINGEVDNWGDKSTGVWLMPFIGLGTYIMFLLLPLMDPFKKNYETFAKTYHLFKNLLLIFFFVLYLITMAASIGWEVRIEIWIPTIIGVMFMIMGNYFGKLKNNWFMGIRTPWTLSSPEIWDKTHRLGGKLFMLAGLIFIVTPWWEQTRMLSLYFIPVIVLVPIIYSFVLFKKLNK